MDLVNNNDFDTNNNFVPILDEHNERIDNNMENARRYVDGGDAVDDNALPYDAHILGNQGT